MKTATITELKNRLSSFIDRVRAGESIVILDRGTPVARLDPMPPQPDQVGRLQRLERAGLVESARQPPPLELMRLPGPRTRGGASAVEALLEERRGGR